MLEIQTDFETGIGSSYLESRVLNSFEQNGLIHEKPVRIFYDPKDFGENYRNVRGVFLDYVARPVMHNIGWVSLAGLGAAGLIYALAPETITSITTVKGLGIAGVAGLVGKVFNLDEILDRTPAKIAKRVFKTNRRPWREAYDKLVIRTLQELEDYVTLGENPNKVAEGDFSDRKNSLALGISISKIADILSSVKADDYQIRGFTLENLFDMFRTQKIGTDEDTKAIYELLDKYTNHELSQRYYMDTKVPGIETLKKVLSNYELSLFIKEAGSVTHLGTKMRRGTIFVEEDVGPKAANFFGEGSVGTDFPIIWCGDDAAQELMNRARRGYSYIGGDVEQGAADGMTGGFLNARGMIHGEFAKKMDDSTWPSIIISLGGIDYTLMDHSIKNGIVVSLNRNRILNRAPEIFRYRDHKMERKEIPQDEHAARIACDNIDDYIKEWVEKHQELVPAIAA